MNAQAKIIPVNLELAHVKLMLNIVKGNTLKLEAVELFINIISVKYFCDPLRH